MATATSPLAGKIDEARKNGYADNETLDHLSQSRTDLAPKIAEARKHGYSSKDILGHIANAKPEPSLESKVRGWADAAQDLTKATFVDPVIGAAKGVGHTLKGAAEITAGNMPVVGKYVRQALDDPRIKAATTPKGIGQKAGFGFEQIAEFFVPGGAEEIAIAQIPKFISGAGKLAKVGRVAAEAVVRGAGATTVSSAQTGSVKEGLETGAFVAGSVPISKGIGKVIGKGISEGIDKTGKSKFTETGTPAEVRELNRIVPGGLGLTAAEIANKPNSWQKIAQYLSSYSYLGKQGIDSRRAAAAGEIQKTVDTWLGTLSRPNTPIGSGMAGKTALDTARDVFNTRAKVLYDAVDKIAGFKIPTDTIKKAIFAERDKLAKLTKAGAKKLGEPEGVVKDLIRDIETINPDITFSEARLLRSRITDRLREKAEDPQARRIYSMALANLDQAMETTAKSFKGDAWKIYRTASDFYKHGMETFENEAVSALVQKNPEALVDSVGPGKISNAISIRRAMTQYLPYAKPEEKAAMLKGFDAFREQWVRKQLLKSVESSGVMDLVGLKDNINKMGRDTTGVLFGFDKKGRDFLKNLNTLAEATANMTKITDHPTGHIIKGGMIAATIAGALVKGGSALTAGGVGATELAVLEGIPPLIVKALYSPKLTKILVDGFTAPTAAKRIANLQTFVKAASVYANMPEDPGELPVHAEIPRPPGVPRGTNDQVPVPPRR